MRMRVLLIAAGVVACAHARPEPIVRRAPPPEPVSAPAPAPTSTGSSALRELLASDMAPHDAIPWSTARRLVWSDFRGRPPSGGRESALTAYALFYGWRCRGQRFEFLVTAGFLPKQSWVKEAVVRDTADSRRVLRHEQTHFDVTEVYARRLRRYFADLAAPCGKTDAELEALAQRLVQEEKTTQQRYDAETEHGLLAPKQGEWSRDLAQQLTALSRYAQ